MTGKCFIIWTTLCPLLHGTDANNKETNANPNQEKDSDRPRQNEKHVSKRGVTWMWFRSEESDVNFKNYTADRSQQQATTLQASFYHICKTGGGESTDESHNSTVECSRQSPDSDAGLFCLQL